MTEFLEPREFSRRTEDLSTERCRYPRWSRRRKIVNDIERFRKNLEQSPHVALSLSDMARMLSLERTYCCRLFRDLTGECFMAWSRRIRIEKAKELLRESTSTITDIAHAVGYSDITTFARNFRRMLGVSPTRFRKSVRGGKTTGCPEPASMASPVS